MSVSANVDLGSPAVTNAENCVGAECLDEMADLLDCAGVPVEQQQQCLVDSARGTQARAISRYGLRTEEQASAALKTLWYPWLANWDPQGKRFQKVVGLDGEEYLVGRAGDSLWAIKLSFLISGTVTISILVFIFGAGILWWLYRSKEGKKVRVRVFGRSRRRRRRRK